jgi:hypothetical protein
MIGQSVIVAGIEIPSSDPVFLTVVAVHVVLGVASTITGAVAMLSPKQHGRHPRFGSIYYWCLTGLFSDSRWAGGRPLARGLPPFYSRDARLCRRIFGAQGAPRALDELGQTAHQRHGSVLRAAADRFLCRQRKEPAALARAVAYLLLVDPRCRRDTADCSCVVATSTGSLTTAALGRRR